MFEDAGKFNDHPSFISHLLFYFYFILMYFIRFRLGIMFPDLFKMQIRALISKNSIYLYSLIMNWFWLLYRCCCWFQVKGKRTFIFTNICSNGFNWSWGNFFLNFLSFSSTLILILILLIMMIDGRNISNYYCSCWWGLIIIRILYIICIIFIFL